MSSGELDKYEYLTGEDLGYRQNPVQKAKFEYSPLGQVFNKGLTTDERQKGLLKRLKNIEDNTDNQLRAIEGQKNGQLAIVKKDNQPKIGGVYRRKMESIKFDDPVLNNLREKIIKELNTKKKLTNTYYITRKSEEGKNTRKKVIDHFTDYAAIDLFAYGIYTKKNVIKGSNKKKK